jgi:phosphatidylglycerol:prolipoprotein diacylglycerol transferase
MSWYGGFVGGVLAGLAMVAWQRLPLMATLSAAAPALTLGHAVGRIGCFLVGDDYGRPTSLPWGIAFPDGLPPTTARVHPTQLYEAAALFVMTAVLIRLRRGGAGSRAVFGTYLVAAGVVRFSIELVRVNVVVLAGMTTAQLFSIGLVIAGAALLATRRREPLVASVTAGRQAQRASAGPKSPASHGGRPRGRAR